MQLPELRIGDLVAKIPIVQGGMGVGISLSGLASAVANEGGIGVIAAAMIGMGEPDLAANPVEANVRALRNEIRKARSLTKGLLGVNIMVALTIFSEIVTAAIEEGIDFIFSGAGLPLDLPKYLKKGSRTKLVPIVSSGRAAEVLCKKWERLSYLPDAFVVEGPMAGGHLGLKPEQIFAPEFTLEKLVAEVLAAVKPFEERLGKAIPVIAAGGIYTGADIYKFLKMGAAGVQMATRFVATHECDADMAFKPGGAAGARHQQRIPGSRQARGKNAIHLPLPLHPHLRPSQQPLLHCAGAHAGQKGESQARFCFFRPERLPCRPDPVGQGVDGFPQA
jgi:nitronate monooxygenase